MINKTSSIFMKDETDNRTKVICVFDVNVTNEQKIEYISKYFEEHEMNEEDEYAPIRSKIDCDVYARNIVNEMGMADFDLDRYWLEVDVPTLANSIF